MLEDAICSASTVTARRLTVSIGTVKPAEVGTITPLPAKRTAGFSCSNTTASSRASFRR